MERKGFVYASMKEFPFNMYLFTFLFIYLQSFI
jgi:hypothetical protein